MACKKKDTGTKTKMPKGTFVSLPTVVGIHEGFLRSALQQILSEDNDGTAFLELRRKTSWLTEHTYEKLARDNGKDEGKIERKVAAILKKAKSEKATMSQLVSLHAFIKEKLGDNISLRIFSHQLKERPMIPPPRSYRQTESALAQQMENYEVLSDVYKLMNEEADKQVEELMQEKKMRETADMKAKECMKVNINLKEENRQLKICVANLTEQQLTLEEHLNETKKKWHMAEGDKNVLQTELESKQKQLNRMKNDLRTAQDKIDKLTDSIQDLKGDNRSLASELKAVKIGRETDRAENLITTSAIVAAVDDLRYRMAMQEGHQEGRQAGRQEGSKRARNNLHRKVEGKDKPFFLPPINLGK